MLTKPKPKQTVNPEVLPSPQVCTNTEGTISLPQKLHRDPNLSEDKWAEKQSFQMPSAGTCQYY